MPAEQAEAGALFGPLLGAGSAFLRASSRCPWSRGNVVLRILSASQVSRPAVADVLPVSSSCRPKWQSSALVVLSNAWSSTEVSKLSAGCCLYR